ncbi:hypothetical protein RSSM_04494 [Rhodopirellula sallentina SM41]|uniref:Uncharacterized protein n=2 Tax=Rhodopirellula TaxID=265488 RepID=M5UDH0_9BACT|nr:hypothetical protein RSSM_04494 [Rhodopirellula sallentina SM41]
MIERGEMPSVSIGKQYRIPKSYVDSLPGISGVVSGDDDAAL